MLAFDVKTTLKRSLSCGEKGVAGSPILRLFVNLNAYLPHRSAIVGVSVCVWTTNALLGGLQILSK